MGKRSSKERAAFESAKSQRELCIQKLNKCQSETEFREILKKYEDKKRKSPLPSDLTTYHSQALRELDAQIKKITEELNARFSPVIPLIPTHEEQEGRVIGKHTTAATLPVEFIEEDNTLDANKDIETQVESRQETKKTLPNPLKGSRLQNQDKRPKNVHFQIEQTSEESTKNFTGSLTTESLGSAKKLTGREKRKIKAQLSDVEANLKIIYTKQLQYEAKAKENRKKKKGLEETKYNQAAVAANSIHQQISGLMNQYLLDGDLKSFQERSTSILDEKNRHVQTLRAHRGWWEEFLDNFVKLINSGFARMSSSIRVSELSMFKPVADGGKKVNGLIHSISSLTPIV